MTLERDRIARFLRDFIVEQLLDDELEADVDPLAADAVDSLGLEQLVDFVASEFGVTIDGEEMVRANFGSIPSLAALIETKLARESTNA
jgi:acyl carrier protein